ncbi:cytochrome P450 [Biscogniauxia mediterranea]|nr:cytochrome P450 [Biscogniauxia mediterranea]
MLLGIPQAISSSDAFFLYLPAFLIAWTILNAASIYQKRPKNIKFAGRTLFWGKWLSTLDFVIRGSATILDSYQKSKRQPFAIPALGEYQVLVSSPKHILEVTRCPESILSFHDAMKKRLRHKITMMGFEHNDIDPDEYVTMQVIKVHLRKNLTVLNPVIQRAVAEGFLANLKGAKSSAEGFSIIPLFSFSKAIVGGVNNQIFFGNDLSQNEDFTKAALRYPWDGSITAEICRYLPEFAVPVVGRVMMAWSGSMRTVGRYITELVDKRVKEHVDGTGEQYVDITQFVITTSRTPRQRDPRRMVQLIAAMLFAVSLAVPMALYWAIINLCIHREYIDALRKEIQDVEQQQGSNPLKGLRLLDSFLRESARLNPPDALAVQRKAIRPFKLSDGTTIPAGNLVAVPQHAMMRDAEQYPDPELFNPRRYYVEGDVDSVPVQKFTDVNMQYPFWGAPAKPCPGRWYASDVLKQILIHLLKNYDFELVGPVNTEPLKLATGLGPRFDVEVKLRARKEGVEGQS